LPWKYRYFVDFCVSPASPTVVVTVLKPRQSARFLRRRDQAVVLAVVPGGTP